ncbi:Zinc finger N-recognin protein [Lasiodiplodia theobromae]|uniref:Zinc finger N-recognin protein n=1 Tax=Lasiodiplodia theobromae TaxID=45133 RepID=UPI0015C3E59E|nr:Zinc finger N-recognin protein [Lasiodiplodia theobromae]KAF4540957.1 Zinc finger N-recognin protein [Lasiodiplodia theobromae]
MAENPPRKPSRSDSISQHSDASQTAQEYVTLFINSQLQLEADAREVLPYQFDTCSRPLGPLRQKAWSCLTCNPPPDDPSEPYTPAGVCYSCHVSCHGEHQLVELFAKRNFVCDCATGVKGDVRAESPAPSNHYDHNYRNLFCGCGQEYDAHQEKGTMYQCLGLGTVEDGGCGEDWWHPECLIGLPRDWYKKESGKGAEARTDQDGSRSKDAGRADSETVAANGTAIETTNGNTDARDGVPIEEEAAEDDPPLPPGFPDEDAFEHLICYKCVEAFPWIKRYADAPGFFPPVYHVESGDATCESSRKRKAIEGKDGDAAWSHEDVKRQRNSQEPPSATTDTPDNPRSTKAICHYSNLPPAPTGRFTLFLKEDFRDQICRCPSCFPLLTQHPYLLEEEDMYEPPVSESDAADAPATGSAGVMVYNHLKDKAYFERLRGDAEGIMAARGEAEKGGDGRKEDGDGGGENGGAARKEQSGY